MRSAKSGCGQNPSESRGHSRPPFLPPLPPLSARGPLLQQPPYLQIPVISSPSCLSPACVHLSLPGGTALFLEPWVWCLLDSSLLVHICRSCKTPTPPWGGGQGRGTHFFLPLFLPLFCHVFCHHFFLGWKGGGRGPPFSATQGVGQRPGGGGVRPAPAPRRHPPQIMCSCRSDVCVWGVGGG